MGRVEKLKGSEGIGISGRKNGTEEKADGGKEE